MFLRHCFCVLSFFSSFNLFSYSCVSIHPPAMPPPIHASIHPSTHPCLHPSLLPSIHPSFLPSIHASIHPSIPPGLGRCHDYLEVVLPQVFVSPAFLVLIEQRWDLQPLGVGRLRLQAAVEGGGRRGLGSEEGHTSLDFI